MIKLEAIIINMLQENTAYKVGNDVLFLPDFYTTLNDVFIRKVFTSTEKEYANKFKTPKLRFASTFSAKEAVYKAVKQLLPDATVAFNKIEITRNRPAGKPTCILHNPALNNLDISLSISHDRDYVWAIALVNFKNNAQQLP